jgi:hypothetical protein
VGVCGKVLLEMSRPSGPRWVVSGRWERQAWAGLSCGLNMRFVVHLYGNTDGIFPAQIQE